MKTIVAGFLGGTSPTLAMAGGYAAAGDIPPIAAGISAAIFGILGSIVAYYTSGDDRKAAFIAGVAAPGIISSLIAGFNDGKQMQTGETVWSMFSTSAYAQDLPGPELPIDPTMDLRTVILNTEISGGMPASASLEISGIMASDGEAIPIAVLPITSGASSISVPSGVSELVVAGETVVLGSSDVISVTVATKPTFWGDVAWGFGGKRNFEIEAITAMPVGQ